MDIFNSIEENVVAEETIKKSKFICSIFYVESIEQAEKRLTQIKKKYYDAKHNCFAYCIETGDGGILIKYNDDGEPAGTAGAPILNLLTSNNLSNILVIVTRYFGGILLGTGGLVKAYTETTKKALNSSKIVEKTIGYEVKITLNYNELEELKYYCQKNDIKIVNINYLDKIEVIIEISKEDLQIYKDNKQNKIPNIDIISQKYVNINKSTK